MRRRRATGARLTVRENLVCLGHKLELRLGCRWVLWVLVRVPLQRKPPVPAAHRAAHRVRQVLPDHTCATTHTQHSRLANLVASCIPRNLEDGIVILLLLPRGMAAGRLAFPRGRGGSASPLLRRATHRRCFCRVCVRVVCVVVCVCVVCVVCGVMGYRNV